MLSKINEPKKINIAQRIMPIRRNNKIEAENMSSKCLLSMKLKYTEDLDKGNKMKQSLSQFK